MEEKEYSIGEEFQVGLSTLKCIEQREDMEGSCEGCFFNPFNDCDDINGFIVGECASAKRKDGKDAIFIKK